ncbi:PepSY-associated TM helix domain-containing protein [Ideonella livida]|uniref:PepSY domain-containing protein n=1 Tax=Ideonella livida TaxID=2707176 RepID=A0A7C9TN40_9BURK|nr:PepSY-associated TM helix domain-containing protein [Ideonella livida]NDY93842.1 PepSY domain-containing protein [Ideonella livida]
MSRTPARRLWLRLHRWLGLGVGAWLLLLGLTGSWLVFYPTLDAWLDPAQRQAVGRNAPITAWEPVLQALKAAEPQRPRGWRIELPPDGRGLITARYLRPEEQPPGTFFAPLLVTVDPATGQAVARHTWGGTVGTWLYNLHFSLLAGEPGVWWVGWAGVLMSVSLLSGLVLWWPRSPGQWRQAWTRKLGAARPRRTWDWHRLTGLYASPLLLVLALTGTLLAWPQYLDPLVARLGPAPALPKPRSELPAPGTPPLTLDLALATVQQAFPQAHIRWVDTPDGPQGVFRFRLALPGDPSERFAHSLVWVDAWRPQVLAAVTLDEWPAAATAQGWLHALHNGEAGGLAGRWAVLALGLLPTVLAWTGLRRWRDRRRGEREAAARRTAGLRS